MRRKVLQAFSMRRIETSLRTADLLYQSEPIKVGYTANHEQWSVLGVKGDTPTSGMTEAKIC